MFITIIKIEQIAYCFCLVFVMKVQYLQFQNYENCSVSEEIELEYETKYEKCEIELKMMCDKNKINSLLLVKKIVFLYFAISRCYCVNFCVKNPCLCLWTNSIKQSESSETLLFYKSPSSKHMNVKLVV